MVTQHAITIGQMDDDYSQLLNFSDLVIRALRNPKLSPVYTCLYLALIDTYPELLRGEAAAIEVWRIRENAGWPSEDSASRFLKDMVSIDAFTYDPGRYDRKQDIRIGKLTPNPDIFPYPEGIDASNVDRKRKAREAEEKRRKQFKDPRKLLQCPECGSEDLLFDVVAHCKCGYVAAPIKDIPANEIIIEAEIVEIQDDLLDMLNDTVKLPVIPKTPVVVQESLTISPAPALGRHRRGIPCPDCGSLNHWRAIPAAGGNTIDVCAICNPDCDTW